MFVTLYHKGSEGYEKQICPNVKLHFSKGIKINENGFSQSNSYVIRIFTDEDIILAPEDKLEIGESANASPSKEALTVLRITDNRVGAHKHWKVECL